MATEKRMIAENDIYALFGENGMARLHVADIDVLPRVDAVEVVHGRWKVSRESEISRNVWCTACGKDFYMHRKGELQIDKMPYCPNCGAKMDGDENG